MTLPSSGQISLNQIHVEVGGGSGSQVRLSDPDVKDLIGANNSNTRFSDYYGASSSQPTATYLTRGVTGGNGFPNGSGITLSSGNKIVVICIQLAGISSTQANTFVSLGGSNMTLAARLRTGLSSGSFTHFRFDVGVYYKETSSSGFHSVAGNGGSGRSSWDAYEITGFNSSTPYTTDTASTTGGGSNSVGITVNSQNGGITIGSAVSFDGTITLTNADAIVTANYESATAHTSWKDENTPTGNRTYTYTNTTETSAQPITLVTASWK